MLQLAETDFTLLPLQVNNLCTKKGTKRMRRPVSQSLARLNEQRGVVGAPERIPLMVISSMSSIFKCDQHGQRGGRSQTPYRPVLILPLPFYEFLEDSLRFSGLSMQYIRR